MLLPDVVPDIFLLLRFLDWKFPHDRFAESQYVFKGFDILAILRILLLSCRVYL